MAEIQLKENQAAIILESSDSGEIKIDVAIPKENADENILASAVCHYIARKLAVDENFQEEIMSGINDQLANNAN